MSTLNGCHHAGGQTGSILMWPLTSQAKRPNHWVRMLNPSVCLEYKLCHSGCAGGIRLRGESYGSLSGLCIIFCKTEGHWAFICEEKSSTVACGYGTSAKPGWQPEGSEDSPWTVGLPPLSVAPGTRVVCSDRTWVLLHTLNLCTNSSGWVIQAGMVM